MYIHILNTAYMYRHIFEYIYINSSVYTYMYIHLCVYMQAPGVCIVAATSTQATPSEALLHNAPARVANTRQISDFSGPPD